jgi:hypothetical protein
MLRQQVIENKWDNIALEFVPSWRSACIFIGRKAAKINHKNGGKRPWQRKRPRKF